MRIVKEADERRNEILDAAEELFGQLGYDKASVQGIINKVGIAKGTFYYYFKSKEEVLDGIVERYNSAIVRKVRAVTENRELGAGMRFLAAIGAMQMSDEVNPAIMEHIHQPQNILLHQKVMGSAIKAIAPILTAVVTEGIESGIFETDFPAESVEMVLIYGMTIIDGDIVELTIEEKEQRMAALFGIGERLFGMKRGSMEEIMRQPGGTVNE